MNNMGFKVGEIAILCNLPSEAAYLNGQECEIIDPLTMKPCFIGNEIFMAEAYGIAFGDALQSEVTVNAGIPPGARIAVPAKYLRKKKPPQEYDEWARDKIKQISIPKITEPA